MNGRCSRFLRKMAEYKPNDDNKKKYLIINNGENKRGTIRNEMNGNRYFEVATMQEMQDFEIDEQAQIQEIIEAAILFYIENAINQSLQDIGKLTMRLEQ